MDTGAAKFAPLVLAPKKAPDGARHHVPAETAANQALRQRSLPLARPKYITAPWGGQSDVFALACSGGYATMGRRIKC